MIPENEKAAYWFYAAAENGYVPAQYALGKMLLSDDKSFHDPELGMEWLEYAAKNGSHWAAYRAGKEYLEGRNVQRDVRKGIEYIQASAHAGNQFEQYLLGKYLVQGKHIRRNRELGFQRLEKAAAQGHIYAEYLLERQQQKLTALDVALSVFRLLYHMSRIFQENPGTYGGGYAHINRKRLKQLGRKRMALGSKDKHSQKHSGPTMSM